MGDNLAFTKGPAVWFLAVALFPFAHLLCAKRGLTCLAQGYWATSRFGGNIRLWEKCPPQKALIVGRGHVIVRIRFFLTPVRARPVATRWIFVCRGRLVTTLEPDYSLIRLSRTRANSEWRLLPGRRLAVVHQICGFKGWNGPCRNFQTTQIKGMFVCAPNNRSPGPCAQQTPRVTTQPRCCGKPAPTNKDVDDGPTLGDTATIPEGGLRWPSVAAAAQKLSGQRSLGLGRPREGGLRTIGLGDRRTSVSY